MKPKFFISIRSILALLLLLACMSCGYESNLNEQETVDELSQNYVLNSTTQVFKTLPSPVQTAELIKRTGVKFDERILNPTRNAPYYETSYSMALNLGGYCADLSYTTFYDQRQLTMEYLTTVKTLADALGITDLIKKDDIMRLEENIYNMDSVKNLVHDVFFTSGEFLNDNNRPEIALLVEVGGWIEGLYIAMQLAKQSGHINKELVDRVAEQRNSLMLVIKSLQDFSNLKPVNEVLTDMQKLKAVYDKMFIEKTQNLDSNTAPKLSNNSNAYVTPEIFMGLYREINNIRNNYTQ